MHTTHARTHPPAHTWIAELATSVAILPQNNLTASVSKRMCLPLVGSASKSIPCSAVPRSQSTQLCLSRRKESVFVQLLSPPPSVRSRALSVPPSLPPSLTHSECQTQITDAVWYKRARPALICAKPSDTNLWICPKSCSVLPKAWRWLLYRPCTNSIVSALLRYYVTALWRYSSQAAYHSLDTTSRDPTAHGRETQAFNLQIAHHATDCAPLTSHQIGRRNSDLRWPGLSLALAKGCAAQRVGVVQPSVFSESA